jgi:uncharacterized membrane protein
MIDIVVYLKNNLADNFVLYFIPLYILGGRPVAVISAQLLGYTALFIVPVVVMLDLLQVPMFYYLYGALSDRPVARKFAERARRREQKLRESGFFRWMQVMGAPGVVAITLLPMKGCGMWSGVLLSKLLRYRKPYGYALLTLGSILGCAVLLGIGECIIALWKTMTGT